MFNGTLGLAILMDSEALLDNGGYLTNNMTFAYSNCSFETTNVAAKTYCTPQDGGSPLCTVTDMQLLPRTTVDTDGNPSPEYAAAYGMYSNLAFLMAGSSGEPGFPSIQELYIENPAEMGNQTSNSTSMGYSLVNISAETFSSSVEILINTFAASIGVAGYYVEGFQATDYSAIFETDGTFIDLTPVWAILPYWLAIFFFCDAIILIFAIADIFLEAKTISPDFLGFASSIVRSNQHLRKEFQGRKLSGLEKARALSDLQVMIQDINDEGEKGKIVLAPKNEASTRLRLDRDYL